MSRRRPDLDDLAVEWDYAESWRHSLARRRAADRDRRELRADVVERACELVVLLVIVAAVAVALVTIGPALK